MGLSNSPSSAHRRECPVSMVCSWQACETLVDRICLGLFLTHPTPHPCSFSVSLCGAMSVPLLGSLMVLVIAYYIYIVFQCFRGSIIPTEAEKQSIIRANSPGPTPDRSLALAYLMKPLTLVSKL